MSAGVPDPSRADGVYAVDFGSARAVVAERFTILEEYLDPSGIPTFRVKEQAIKEPFRELLRDLARHHLIAKITKADDKLIIRVLPRPQLKKPRTVINLSLLAATVLTVSVASYRLIVDVDPRVKGVLFSNSSVPEQISMLALSILGIVGVHELGHLLAIRHHRMDATLPYFVPAPPPFPFGTFGAIISLRGPPANRDQLFDLGFSGPVAGFIATIIVAFFAYMSAPVITENQAARLIESRLLSSAPWPHIPLLMDLLGKFGLRTIPSEHVLVLTQLAFAAEIGALITFLNLLPIWQLDGGHIARATLGVRGHRIAAVVGLVALFMVGYWGFALLILLFMLISRRPVSGVETLDDISPLSNSRKAYFALSLLILALSFVIL